MIRMMFIIKKGKEIYRKTNNRKKIKKVKKKVTQIMNLKENRQKDKLIIDFKCLSKN